jgi:hypothetical protein
MRRLTLLGPAVLLVVASVACATSSRRTTITTSEAAGELDTAVAPVTVHVKSSYPGPLVVYSMNEGIATRLGDVQGAREERFRLAATSLPVDGVTLIAVPVSGVERATTGRLIVAPGAIIEFTIAATLANSTGIVKR